MATTDVASKLDRTNPYSDKGEGSDTAPNIVVWKRFWRLMNTRGYSYRPASSSWSLLFLDSDGIFRPVSWSSSHIEMWSDIAKDVFEILRDDGFEASPTCFKSMLCMGYPDAITAAFAAEHGRVMLTPSEFGMCHVRMPNVATDEQMELVYQTCNAALENQSATDLFLYQIGHILCSNALSHAKPRNFVILEGLPGTSKSTFMEAFVNYIESKGYSTTQIPPLRAGFGWGECANSHLAYQDDASPEELMALMKFPAFLSFVSHNTTKSEEKGKDHKVHRNPLAAYLLLCNRVPAQIVNSPEGMLSRALILRVSNSMSKMVSIIPDIASAGVRIFKEVWENDADVVAEWIENNRKKTLYSMTTGVVTEIVKKQYNLIRSACPDLTALDNIKYSTAMLYYFMPYMDGFTSELSSPVLEQRIDALVKWYTLPGNTSSKPPQDALHNHLLYKGVYVPTNYRKYLASWEHITQESNMLKSDDVVELSAREKATIARDMKVLFGV